MKRIIDVIVSAAGIFLLAPIFLGVAIAVRISMGSPVLFRQLRPGKNGRLFTLLKFRTMRESGPDVPDEQRLTGPGRFLRSTSLDELPELVNVLRGEMSLVGPRPLLPEYLPLYSPVHARRHEVRPGITGWAQINGRNGSSWKQKLSDDVWYVDNRSLLLDLKILAITVRKVFTREGISAPGHATTERFDGNV